MAKTPRTTFACPVLHNFTPAVESLSPEMYFFFTPAGFVPACRWQRSMTLIFPSDNRRQSIRTRRADGYTITRCQKVFMIFLMSITPHFFAKGTSLRLTLPPLATLQKRIRQGPTAC
ncbi:hypothetical protein KL86DES1_10662 [uncultured Desulfovibrio sp.]|uniref:Uncharacterized protein n=1 Tax=uncultured Desulfovibrio sp. TaxID=167968 RepID=A0A212KZU2_9BACT|nr:hypothetical protein KL86DES1_10662 [uncultured Desulfovibrio sp.]VZH32535.1 conserved protein of unknown function [Desulfovibrio sp. 86]